MEPFLIYLGKVALAMGAFYLMFLMLFQRQKHFRFNRLYLLASMGISYLIPLITFTVIEQVEAMPVQNFTEPLYAAVPSYTPVVTKNPYEWYHYLFVLLLLGAAGFLLHFVIGSLKAWNIIRKSYRKNELGQNICITRDDVHPFSFFNKVVISEKNLSHPNLDMILSHEKVHVKERHTFDILIAEILFLLEWLNPFAWLLKDAVKSNLEFLTDDNIVRENDREAYQLAMVSLADKQGVAPFLTALNGSQLKNRIIMMKKKTTKRFAVARQLLILPLLAVLVMGLSNKEVKTEFVEYSSQIKNINSKNNIIYGKVTDSKNKPIQGAKIYIKGSPIEARTDNNGLYKIYLYGENDSLIYEAPGFERKETEAKNVNNIDVELKKVKNNLTTFGGEFKFEGIIYLSEKNTPIPSVGIYDKLGHLGCETNEKGEFSITTKNNDEFFILKKTGFIPKTIKFSSLKKQNSKIDIYLEKNNDENVPSDIISLIEKYNQYLQDWKKDGYYYLDPKVEESPLILIDGKELTKPLKLAEIEIEKISGNQPPFAFETYGEKGIDGVYNFITKKKTANHKIITGKVTDKNGKPIIGAMLIEYDKDGKVLQGCTTDINGEFKYETKSGNSVIKCNAIGYKEKEITINEGEDLTIVLQKDPKIEDDYGKIKITGCVTDENGNKLSNVAVVIEGIWISTYTDETGNYEIRVKNNKDILLFKYPNMKGEKITVGDQRIINVTLKKDKTSSTNNINIRGDDDKKPLYVVDGKITKNIDDISINDVSSVTVLKDEQAKELYGEKGEDGVIIIDVQTEPENEKATLHNDEQEWKVEIVHIEDEASKVQNMNTGKIEWRIRDYEPKAMIIVDGEEVSKPVEQIDPTSIENVNIFKGEVAREVYGIKGENGVIEITTKNSEGAVYNFVDEIPQFPGGPKALYKYLQENLQYPEIAMDNGILGRVLVTITIDEDGKVLNPRIARGVDPSLDKEAVRVAGTLPNWEPGKVDGKPVKTNFSLPVEFKLPNHPQGYKTLTVRNSATESADAPLWVIDGKVIGTGINKPDINPEDVETLTVLKGERATEKYGEKAKNGVIEITTKEYAKNHPELKEKTDSESSSKVYTKEELFFQGGSNPEFPGGKSSLSNYVADKVNYPVIAQQNGIQGEVFVTFTIDKKGNVQNPYISKGVDPVLDDEALRVVKSLPKWEPAKLKGKPVDVLYTVPITFKLQ